MKVYFTEFFNVSEKQLEEYGAFNISLINDLPLFIDPFLLFNSSKSRYQELHKDILKYLKFLKDKSQKSEVTGGLLKAWYEFPEVKQNWLGFCKKGNSGSGLGASFARALNKNLRDAFKDFGNEKITKSSHLEKLCLIKDGVGRDNISDFTTNLILEFLLEYTENFAEKNIDEKLRRDVVVEKVKFNYDTETWMCGMYNLPYINGDFVLLTPKDILTKDEAWINRGDMINGFDTVINAMGNTELVDQINNYLFKMLPSGEKRITKKEYSEAVEETIDKFPNIIDYFIKYKEDNGDRAIENSKHKVFDSEDFYISKCSQFINLLSELGFYKLNKDTYSESLERVKFLKHVIENNDGYKLFYLNGKPISKESDLQLLYRLTWFASEFDANREVNNGRGPVDYKVSFGSADSTLIEFKLAKSSKLKKNILNQVEVYEDANNTKKSIKVIMYYTIGEYEKVKKILRELKLEGKENIILIDARSDNKISASNV